jgi:hypothetical protein
MRTAAIAVTVLGTQQTQKAAFSQPSHGSDPMFSLSDQLGPTSLEGYLPTTSLSESAIAELRRYQGLIPSWKILSRGVLSAIESN